MKFCQEKLVSLVDLYGEDHPAVIHMRKRIVDFDCIIEKFGKKQSYYIRELNLCSADDLHKRRELLSGLSSFYFDRFRYTSSIHYGFQLLIVNKKLLLSIVDDLKHLGRCYFEMREYDRALAYIKHALAVYESDPKSEPGDVTHCSHLISEIEEEAQKNKVDISSQFNIWDIFICPCCHEESRSHVDDYHDNEAKQSKTVEFV
jgi:tetratricopeptide (TPR) repeat protein